MLYDIEVLIDRRDLNEQHAFDLMKTLIASGTDLEKTVFLLAMHMKGMTGQELTGYANAVRSESTLAPIPGTSDIVGTGGDGKKTINVSTAAAILCAGMGIRIAKHGNRSITSPLGSADVLSHMNYDFEKSREDLLKTLNSTGFIFLLAPYYNNSFAKFFPARKMLTFKTIMNFMGPITNPADPERLVIGSSDNYVCDLYADFLAIRKKRGFILHGEDGMDEFSPVSRTRVISVDERRSEFTISPEELEMPSIDYSDVSFEDPNENKERMLRGLFGVDEKISAFIAANASPLLVLNDLASNIQEGYSIARKAISSGDGKRGFKLVSGGRDSFV